MFIFHSYNVSQKAKKKKHLSLHWHGANAEGLYAV